MLDKQKNLTDFPRKTQGQNFPKTINLRERIQPKQISKTKAKIVALDTCASQVKSLFLSILMINVEVFRI